VRVTLTLDDDVAAKLKAESRRSGKSFKESVNHFLRLGLSSEQRFRTTAKRFKVKARPLGERPGLNYDDVWGLIEHVDGPPPSDSD